MRNSMRYNPRAKVKRDYGDRKEWDAKTKDLIARDGDICARCGISRTEAHRRGRRMVKAHIFSVQTGNNRNSNLRILCEGPGGCHNKDPKHSHIERRYANEAAGYNSLQKKLARKAQDMGLPGSKRKKK